MPGCTIHLVIPSYSTTDMAKNIRREAMMKYKSHVGGKVCMLSLNSRIVVVHIHGCGYLCTQLPSRHSKKRYNAAFPRSFYLLLDSF